MRQEPNTESDSEGSKPRLALKRKSGGSKASEAPSKAAPVKPERTPTPPSPEETSSGDVEAKPMAGESLRSALRRRISEKTGSSMAPPPPPPAPESEAPPPPPVPNAGTKSQLPGEDWDAVGKFAPEAEPPAPVPTPKLAIAPREPEDLDVPPPPPPPSGTPPPIPIGGSVPGRTSATPPGAKPAAASAHQPRSAKTHSATSPFLVVAVVTLILVGLIGFVIFMIVSSLEPSESSEDQPVEIVSVPSGEAAESNLPDSGSPAASGPQLETATPGTVAIAESSDSIASVNAGAEASETASGSIPAVPQALETPEMLAFIEQIRLEGLVDDSEREEQVVRVESSESFDATPSDELTVRMGDLTPVRTGRPDDVQQDPMVLAFLNSVSVRGVSPRKVQLDSTVYERGQVIMPETGLKWMHYDPELKVLYFVDARGARYEKDYYN